MFFDATLNDPYQLFAYRPPLASRSSLRVYLYTIEHCTDSLAQHVLKPKELP